MASEDYLGFANPYECDIDEPEDGWGPYERCPRCGGVLVKRVRRTDCHAFAGCSNYPKCHFTCGLDATVEYRDKADRCRLESDLAWNRRSLVTIENEIERLREDAKSLKCAIRRTEKELKKYER